MLKTREFVTAAGTLACAVGIGFIMQSSDTAKERYGDKDPVPATDVVKADLISSVVKSNAVLKVDDIMLTSAQTQSGASAMTADTGVQLAAAGIMPDAPALVDTVPLPACDISASATPAPGAMISVSLIARCLPNERVNVHHNGMVFTQSTDNSGRLSTTVPAMARDAVVIFAFSDGDGAVTETRIDDIDNYDRTALQWRGDTGFQIHAREFGAGYGQAGHVWAGTPRAEGTLVRLGDTTVAEAFVAEVYTFPRTAASRDGVVDLSIEAEVTAANCGREIAAQSLEITEDGIKTQDLTLAVPDCDAMGDFLVLNNLVPDLKVASN